MEGYGRGWGFGEGFYFFYYYFMEVMRGFGLGKLWSCEEGIWMFGHGNTNDSVGWWKREEYVLENIGIN
jgi:hypothetical protein